MTCPKTHREAVAGPGPEANPYKLSPHNRLPTQDLHIRSPFLVSKSCLEQDRLQKTRAKCGQHLCPASPLIIHLVPESCPYNLQTFSTFILSLPIDHALIRHFSLSLGLLHQRLQSPLPPASPSLSYRPQGQPESSL